MLLLNWSQMCAHGATIIMGAPVILWAQNRSVERPRRGIPSAAFSIAYEHRNTKMTAANDWVGK